MFIFGLIQACSESIANNLLQWQQRLPLALTLTERIDDQPRGAKFFQHTPTGQDIGEILPHQNSYVSIKCLIGNKDLTNNSVRNLTLFFWVIFKKKLPKPKAVQWNSDKN